MSRPNPGALLEVSVNDNDDEVLEYEQSSDEEEERSEQDPSNSILLGGGVEPEPGASQSSGVPWMGVTRNSGPPVKLPKPVATIPTALLEKLQSLSILRVKCNLQCGYLFKNKFACGKRGKCIRYNDKFWTPIGFEKAVGCGYRRWTKSIRVALRDERFITLDQLIRLPEPILQLHDARLCRCRVCYHGRDRKREIVYASLQPPLSPEPAFPPVASNVSSAEKPSRDETEKPARKSSRVPKAVEQAGSADSKPKMVPDTCKNATERKHILEMMKRFGATNFQAIADGIGDPSITAERVEAIVRRLLKKIREEDALHGLYPLDSWLEEEDAAFSKSFNATRCWGVMFRLMAIKYHKERKREIVYASLQPPLSPEPALPPVASNVSSAEKPSRDETEKPTRKSSRVPKAVEQTGSADSKPKMVPDTCKNATERKHILEMMKRFGATNFQAIADGIRDPSITAERVEAIVRRLLKKIREEDALHGLYPLDSWLEEEDAAFSKSFNATRCWGVMFRLMAIKYHKESPKEDLDYSAIYEALADLMEGQPPKELRSLEGQKILQLCDRLKAFLEASDIRNHDLFLLNQLNLRSVIDPDLVLVEAALSPSRSASASKSTTVNR
ncbi:unnamed protein product [Cyprideis torosa]|uniref:Uncharacterized protein n=1 Tax=Cyprideis torosa TaxID=163714 RepID=A0A7R8ZLY6_9CRUS|nr:unnamed protein product [Cyprideis torosa]CAG0894336.1 unnamed protein product [Cyprideis torosa]